MYFLENPVSFPIRTRIDVDQNVVFLKSTVRVNCVPNVPVSVRKLDFQISDANDAIHFQAIATDHWGLRDLDDPIGNARVVELSFDGEGFTKRFQQDRCGDATRSLFESIVSQGSIALFVNVPGLDEAAGFDNLIVNLSIQPLE